MTVNDTPGGIRPEARTTGMPEGPIDMTAPATIDSAGPQRAPVDSAAPPRVLDVRTPGEFETAHIAGAYNVPLDLLREHRDEILTHLDEDVVLVCRSGQRAAQAEETLRSGRPGQRAHPRRRDHRLGGKGFRGQPRCAALGPRASGPPGRRLDRADQHPGQHRRAEAQVGGRRRSARGLAVAALTNTCAMGMAAVEAALQPRRHL